MSNFNDFARGGLVGFSTVMIGYPFDTVKTNLQNRNFYSMTNTFKSIYQTQGVKGFYRGAHYPFIFLITKRTYQYPLYERLKSHFNPFLSGALTGVSGTILGCPMHNIKIKIQNKIAVASKNSQVIENTNIYSIVKEIMGKRGWKGFYLGFYPTLVRDFFYGGSFLGFYGIFRQYAKNIKFNNYWMERGKYGICSATSSLITWSLFIPIDTIKNNIQSEKKYFQLKNRISKDGLIRTLWAGYTPAVIRTIPASVISLIIYEWLGSNN